MAGKGTDAAFIIHAIEGVTYTLEQIRNELEKIRKAIEKPSEGK